MPWVLVDSKSLTKDLYRAKHSKCFFSMGSKGVFLGIANPLSGKAILNACVIPTCLSGCENWILNDVLLSTLEAFQGMWGVGS